MTNLRRTIASTAVAVVIAAGLLAGAATPALAGPFPPITPGPSVPPLPPGYDARPAVKLPTCATILTTLPGTDVTSGWGDPTGSRDSIPTAIARSERHVSCVYQTGTSKWVFITIAATNSGDYANLISWYSNHSNASAPGGTTGEAGTSSDTHYYIYGTNTAPLIHGDEQEFVSNDGWWVAVSTLGTNSGTTLVKPLIADAVTRLLTANPLRR